MIVQHKGNWPLIRYNSEGLPWKEMSPLSLLSDYGCSFLFHSRVMHSLPWNDLDMNATGRPPWFNVAEIATSDASHSTTKGMLSSIDCNEALSIACFIALKSANSSSLKGKEVTFFKDESYLKTDRSILRSKQRAPRHASGLRISGRLELSERTKPFGIWFYNSIAY